MTTTQVRGFNPDDWQWVLALNAANEIATAPLSEADLAKMARESCLMAACGQGAFLIAFDQASDYASPNFLWFRDRFANFVYVDRVVVDATARRRGLARALYAHLIAETRAARCERVVCEVNHDPPNPSSDAFHASMGFAEIGRARLENGKYVRYLQLMLDVKP